MQNIYFLSIENPVLTISPPTGAAEDRTAGHTGAALGPRALDDQLPDEAAGGVDHAQAALLAVPGDVLSSSSRLSESCRL